MRESGGSTLRGGGGVLMCGAEGGISGRPALGHSEGQKGGEEGREHRKEISSVSSYKTPRLGTPRIPDTCHTFTLSAEAPLGARG